jgi:CRP-like cAMP-binding protein
MAGWLRLQDLPKGGYFVRAGEIPTRIGYILYGWLQYFYTNADGKKLVRYFCKGENFVSSHSALTRGAPSAFSIQALEDSKLVVFKYRDWLQLLETHPAWAIMPSDGSPCRACPRPGAGQAAAGFFRLILIEVA